MAKSLREFGEGVEFGPKRLEFVPYTAINELPQVRTAYDPRGIEDLASAIEMERGELTGFSAHSPQFDLANPLSIGRHTRKSAQQYIADHGDYFRIPEKDRIDPQDLTPLDDDTALLLIAGHRRRRAIGRLITAHNIQPETAQIASNVHDDVDFGYAIGLQLRENVYERPAPQDEARAIDLAYRYIQRKTGHLPAKAHLAKQLGFSETKVRDALDFASLPDSIQAYTTSGVLSYSVTRQLKPLYDTFIKYQTAVTTSRSTEVITAAAEASLQAFCDSEIAKRLSDKSSDTISRVITQKIRAVEDEIAWAGQQEFELGGIDFDQSPAARRARAGKALTETAIAVINYRLQAHELQATDVAKLQALLDEYHQSNQPTHEVIELPLGLASAS